MIFAWVRHHRPAHGDAGLQALPSLAVELDLNNVISCGAALRVRCSTAWVPPAYALPLVTWFAFALVAFAFYFRAHLLAAYRRVFE